MDREKTIEKFEKLLDYLEKNKKYCIFYKIAGVEEYINTIINELSEIKEAKNKEEMMEELGDSFINLLTLIYKMDDLGIVSMEKFFEGIIEKLKKRKSYVFEEKEIDWEEMLEIFFKNKKEEFQKKGKWDLEQEMRDEVKIWLGKFENRELIPLSVEGEEFIDKIYEHLEKAKKYLERKNHLEAFENIIIARNLLDVGESLGYLKFDKKL